MKRGYHHRLSIARSGRVLLRMRLVLVLITYVGAIANPARSDDALNLINSEVPITSRNSDADFEFFEKSIRPILVEHCYECHSGDEDSGGLLLDSRDALAQGGDSGAAIVSGRPEDSLLIQAVRYGNRDLQMPPKNRLENAQIKLLENWIGRGAPDPRMTTLADQAAASGMSVEDGRDFWSFRPVDSPPVPSFVDNEWIRTPIDAFVFEKLLGKGITPAPRADRETLIRRITYDLIGLPPTRRQIEAFVADSSPDAIENLVDRLLASPQYGVRWGRHWLDVARYADSNGLDENLAFGNAWRYRDYVVQSINDDKPFDRFLVEQIAGDLLPAKTLETQTATGFLVLGAKVLAEPDDEKLVMDTVDEQIDVIGKTFLGMTLGCVRCHDHKFDPVKQTDYYSLAAIFKSTKTFGDTKTGAIKHWNEIDFASDDELSAIKAVEEEIAKKKAEATKFKNSTLASIRSNARKQAVDYLIAATKIDIDTPLNEIEKVALPHGLHPRILHHCRRHLKFHADDAFFRAWHSAKGDDHASQVERHYRPLFLELEQAVAKSDDSNEKTVKLSDPRLEQAWHAVRDPSGFLAVPTKAEFAFDDKALAEYNLKMDEARLFESRAPDRLSAMGVTDSTVHHSLPIHIRGSHLNLGNPVTREFPKVMRTSSVRPVFPNNQSGRLELAKWMASSLHPLTARVYVNRVWARHFGTGIVASTENFGVLGDRPSHPKLLDWLARDFIQNGWSTKQLHRMIIRSSTYQMAALHPNDEMASKTDPENRLRWKFPVWRLDAEQIRDSILAASGDLDLSIGGKTIPLRNRQFVFDHTSVDHTKYDSLRRAMYLPVIRNHLYSLFQQFDFPDPTMPTGSRQSTTVAPQALWMMNSDLMMDAASKIAGETLSLSAGEASRVEFAYHRILSRQPTENETRQALTFIRESSHGEAFDSQTVDPVAINRSWILFCQSLLASNEFIFVK